jgi:hypothetical protein
MGGSAIRDACPTPFLTDAANLVDQCPDDDDAEISEPVLRTDAEIDLEQSWETPCPSREDGKHCEHWYDDTGPCCGCGDPPTSGA